jgi:hypothetical protein
VYLLGVGLALVALGLGITDLALSPRAGVTTDNVQRLRNGMTFGEVKRILGRDPDRTAETLCGKHPPGTSEVAHWLGGPGGVQITISLDRRDVVVGTYCSHQQAGTGLLARLHAWLGW